MSDQILNHVISIVRDLREGTEDLPDWDGPLHHGQHRYCPKCDKMETSSECKYGPKYWSLFSLPSEPSDSIKPYMKVLRTTKEETEISEEAPVNAVGDGSKVALPPTHEPPVKPRSRFIFQRNTRRNWKK